MSTRSDGFRTRWAAPNGCQHFTGRKHFHHPIVGELHLLFEAMELSADSGLSLFVYSPEPGTPPTMRFGSSPAGPRRTRCPGGQSPGGQSPASPPTGASRATPSPEPAAIQQRPLAWTATTYRRCCCGTSGSTPARSHWTLRKFAKGLPAWSWNL
nr:MULTISPECIES: hypothetical protein [unclassified Arthrobacter]